jgi:hypothetical protein
VATRTESEAVAHHLAPRLAILTAAALLGAADAGLFVVTDPQTALKTPGRAAGSLAGLAVWVLLLAVSGRRWLLGDSRRLAAAGLGLALLAALDGVGLAAIHAMARVGGARTLVGAAAGLTALGLAVTARRAEA